MKPKSHGGDPAKRKGPFRPGGDPAKRKGPFRPGGDPAKRKGPFRPGGDPAKRKGPFRPGGDPAKRKGPFRPGGDPAKRKVPFRPGSGGKERPHNVRRDASPGERISPARAAAYEILAALERGAKISEALIHSISPRDLNSKDTALVRELVYGVTRMRRFLDHQVASLCDRPFQRFTPAVRISLRLGAYQLLFLDSIPAHAAVHESVTLVKRAGEIQAAGFVNALLRSVVEKKPLPLPEGPTPVATMALRHSHPDWLVERWSARFGDSGVEAILSAGNRPHSLFMRVRPGTREGTMEALRKEGFSVEAIEWPPDTFVLSGRGSGLFESESFQRGDWIVQDWTPQAMMELCPLEAGMRVWDVCAAPGTKSVGLAWRIGSQGSVLASDVSAERLRLLTDNVKRLGIENIRVHEGDVRRMQAAEKFNLIWVDAPCTGTGVLSRRADLRWRIAPEDVARHAKEQKELLHEVARRVYPGGFLLYSTCSLEDEENGEVVSDFLRGNTSFRPFRVPIPLGFPEIREEATGTWFLPTSRHDGGFLAVFRRES